MKFCLIMNTPYGIVVYEAGSDPAKAVQLMVELDRPSCVAVLHPRRDLVSRKERENSAGPGTTRR